MPLFFARALALSLLSLSLAHGSTAPEKPKKPNVLFIAIDDLNDWIGCLGGHPQAQTPNLDRLAARGVLFTNAHCASPACKPSRAAVFSGLRPSTTKVWSNRTKSLHQLRPDAVKMPQPFAKKGYRTLGAGKLMHDKRDDAFEEYFQVEQRWSPLTREQVEYTQKELPSKATNNPRHLVTDSQGKEVVLPLNRMPSDRAPSKKGGESFDWGPWEVPDSDFGDTQITNWAIKQLETESNEPFFLAMGYYRPHIPLWAPKRFFERFRNDPGLLPPFQKNDLADLSEAGKHWALFPDTAGLHSTVVKYQQWEKAIEGYLACVTYVDHEIGRLLDALDHSSAKDNTIIIVWSDHGWHLGEKQHWGKWTGWERSTRVPLIIVPPNNQAEKFSHANACCAQPVSLLDLFPTLAEWCEVESPAHLAGQSLLPLLREPSLQTGRALVTSFDEGNYAVRDERWRFIHYADGSEELYDLKNDPNEWSNLIADPAHRSLVQKLKAVAAEKSS